MSTNSINSLNWKAIPFDQKIGHNYLKLSKILYFLMFWSANRPKYVESYKLTDLAPSLAVLEYFHHFCGRNRNLHECKNGPETIEKCLYGGGGVRMGLLRLPV